MSLFCIVWSKNSHRTCISVCTSALSEQLCRVCAEARYEKALNTHTHARSHAHTLSLSVSFWNTDANTHCPSPLCKHTHPQMLSHRQTDAAPFGHIFSLLCQGVLADLPLFECSATLVCVCLCVCVCEWAEEVGICDHLRVHTELVCVYSCLDPRPSIWGFHKVCLSVMNNRESRVWKRK